ncbi:MAG: hypothetical protein LBT78_09140 [Tannerella sp.]|jgi:hypothetical protein|nr:hypothetical protein [Tannerella sp.]
MTAKQLQQIVSQGETTTVQFKIRSEEAYKMGEEYPTLYHRPSKTVSLLNLFLPHRQKR